MTIPLLVHAGAYLLAFVLAGAGVLLHGRDAAGGQDTAGVPTSPYRWWDGVVAFLLIQIFCGLVLIAMAASESKPASLTLAAVLASIVFQGVLAGVVVMVMGARVNPLDWLGLRWKQWPQVFWIAPLGVLVMWMFLGGLMALDYMGLMEKLGAEPVQETVRVLQEAKDPFLLLGMSVAAVLVAPVCEELIFRGYCYPVLKKYAGPWPALISSSLFFACAHGNLASFLPLFLLGVLLVVVYEKTRSLWAPIAVHFLFNSVTVVIQFGARILELS